MANKADLEKGLELRKKLLGKRASAVTALGELAPDLEEIMNEVLFGRVWTRPGLEPKMRSAITLGMMEPKNAFHLIDTFVKVASYVISIKYAVQPSLIDDNLAR